MVVYSRPSCAPCRTLKYYLDKKGIKYEEREPDETVTIVPTVEINGERVVGLNFQELARLLAAPTKA